MPAGSALRCHADVAMATDAARRQVARVQGLRARLDLPDNRPSATDLAAPFAKLNALAARGLVAQPGEPTAIRILGAERSATHGQFRTGTPLRTACTPRRRRRSATHGLTDQRILAVTPTGPNTQSLNRGGRTPTLSAQHSGHAFRFCREFSPPRVHDSALTELCSNSFQARAAKGTPSESLKLERRSAI
jgi:hypothetical protein